MFATQSLADIANSSIAPALVESCPTRIFLPNERAQEPQSKETYQRFGLNARQIELISRATPKRDYYYQSPLGARVFDLGLGPIALAICGASGPVDQERISKSLAEAEPQDFAETFLHAKGLSWAADLLTRWPGASAETASDIPPAFTIAAE